MSYAILQVEYCRYRVGMQQVPLFLLAREGAASHCVRIGSEILGVIHALQEQASVDVPRGFMILEHYVEVLLIVLIALSRGLLTHQWASLGESCSVGSYFIRPCIGFSCLVATWD